MGATFTPSAEVVSVAARAGTKEAERWKEAETAKQGAEKSINTKGDDHG